MAGSPAVSRQVSDDEDEEDTEFRLAPDPEDAVFFNTRSGSEASD